LSYDSQGRITQAVDNAGRTVLYAYDAGGRLFTVTDLAGGITTYTYDDQNRMLTIKDPRNIVYLTNQYDSSSGRVTQQTQADNGTFLFSWTPTANPFKPGFIRPIPTQEEAEARSCATVVGTVSSYNRYSSSCGQSYMPLVAQVDVTDPRGYVHRVVFGPTGNTTSDTHALGQPEQQTVTYSYYADNTVQSVTDALGRVTSFDYDSLGNTTRVTRLDGTPSAVTSTFSYEPQFNRLASVTDPLGHTSNMVYDPNGNLTAITDAVGHSTTFATTALAR